MQTLLSGGFKTAIRGESDASHNTTLAQRIVAGGYPESARRRPARSRTWHREYLRSIVERDVRDVAKVKEFDDVARLLKLLALRTGELPTVSDLANELTLGRATVERYVTRWSRSSGRQNDDLPLSTS